MKLVLLTEPCERVARMVEVLGDNGVPVDAVVLSRASLLETGRGLVRVLPWHRILWLAVRRLHVTLTTPASRNWRRPEFYRSRALEVITAPHLNSEQSVRRLKELDADIGIIGCSGILSPDVFNSFRLGVLNIHPGLIPEYRGRSPVEWALLEEGDIGVTLHFIDAGIDTGQVVSREHVLLQPGDTIGSVYRKADRIGLELLLAALERARSGVGIPSTRQSASSKPAYSSMPRALVKVARRRLNQRAGRARAPAASCRSC